ncbi:MAG: thioredoxin domain-containing protein [Oscillospiraceae bacterium]|nr:thioredoxin domain-containing protein [Oscillospiraceae bacterium]
MAHESFEDAEVAEVLNQGYVSIKADKEERPDIDSVYMSVCQMLTGSGGWPLTVIMDCSGKPFFAGTYFPKTGRYRMAGLTDILTVILDKWHTERDTLLRSAARITGQLGVREKTANPAVSPELLCEKAVEYFKATFDLRYGGFGRAPKFPSPHNLLFLLEYHKLNGDKNSLFMAEKTLEQMARGGIFDHIGFGFSRYSTDEKWLAPHFEKMLYDNALLVSAYAKAYQITGNPLYKSIAEKTLLYIRREMTHPGGGFYSAQDADSDGVEGKYYVFTPDEIIFVLGKDMGEAFCEYYDITDKGNFEGKNIPNLIHNSKFDERFADASAKLYDYRLTRTALHRDEKILTSWNALMIAAFADAAAAFGNDEYLNMAKRAMDFIETHLYENGRLLASYCDGRRSEWGFIDDYAFTIYALLRLYQTTADNRYFAFAETLADTAITDFFDFDDGGFYLYGSAGEALITRPKECYDGAMPSGNSVMAMNLEMLYAINGSRETENVLLKQNAYMNAVAADAPAGHTFYLLSKMGNKDLSFGCKDGVCGVRWK